MKFPVYLHKAESGTFSGFIPDIVGCIFAGDTIDDALADASSAIDAHLEYMAEKGRDLPAAQDISAHIDDEDCRGGIWAYVDIDMSRYDGKAVKLNITIPQNVLTKIDEYVEAHREYSSRSGFLVELARREMQRTA